MKAAATAAATAVAVEATIRCNNDDNDDGGGGGGQNESSYDISGNSGSRRWRETEALQLKKILEWELSLDARDLRSHAWYHGAIARAKAEQIVAKQDGDFLVRDCTSQPGNYVLSCRSKGQNLHFVINKIVLQPDTVYESVQYRFEDDGFDTVPDLITYYVGSGKPITVASAARIQNPQNRRYPLSFWLNATSAASTTTTTTTPPPSPPPTFGVSYSPTARRRIFAITTMHKKQRGLSSRCDDNGGGGGGSSSIRTTNTRLSLETDVTALAFSASLPRRQRASDRIEIRCSTLCADTDPSHSGVTTSQARDCKNYGAGDRLCGSHRDSESAKVDVRIEPPPKPSRIFKSWSSSDSGNGSDDSAQSFNAANGCGSGSGDDSRADKQSSSLRKMSGVIVRNPKYRGRDHRIDGNGDYRGAGGDDTIAAATATVAITGDTSVVSERDEDVDENDDDDVSYGLARVNVPPTWPAEALTDEAPEGEGGGEREKSTRTSVFDLDAFHTLLLPAAENKPLDTCALQGVHTLLMDSGSRILANHLTRADLELTVNHSDRDRVASNTCRSGIELSLLPQGRRRRLDLIERSECMRLLVAVTVLTCATELERAEILNKWIEVAIETKTALGNLYGFCGVMLGLCSPQVQRLNETWHVLRQRYTDSAFNFEAKLRPTLKCMNESTNPLAPNTTIPHLLPVVLLYETNYPSTRIHASGADDDDDDVLEVENTYVWDVCVNQWEESAPDLGLSTLYSHLNATRQFRASLPTFRRNAEIVLADSKIDHLLCDVFRTEFHLKFLWGSRGAKVNAAERYFKFHQVLNVMSEKCESETVTVRRRVRYDDGSSPSSGDTLVADAAAVPAAAVAAAESAATDSLAYNSRHFATSL